MWRLAAGLSGPPNKSEKLFPGSQRRARAAGILAGARRRRPMQPYITAIGMAFGLVVVWAALVPFIA
jgi:hypothetical protein